MASSSRQEGRWQEDSDWASSGGAEERMRGLAEALHLAVPRWPPKMEDTRGSLLEPWYLPHGQDPPT